MAPKILGGYMWLHPLQPTCLGGTGTPTKRCLQCGKNQEQKLYDLPKPVQGSTKTAATMLTIAKIDTSVESRKM